MKEKLINFIKAIVYIFLFYVIYALLAGIYNIFIPKISGILSSLTIIITYACIKKKDINKDLDNLKKTNYKRNIILFIIMFLITESCTIIFPKVFNIMITNQATIEESISKYPLITFVSSCLMAPIYEEILFRKDFKKSFDNKWIFTIVTGTLFASIHCITISSLIELVYAPLYLILGLFLSYIYYTDNNILTSIKYHTLNNILAYICIFIF